jgi:hypothetical protein
MTPYTVDWQPAAEDALTEIWIDASDRAAVTAAQARADRLLARDPANHGRHVAEGLYQIDSPPLAISYTIDEDRRLVEVTWVREIVS